MSETTYRCGWCGAIMDEPYMTLIAKFKDDKVGHIEGYFCRYCCNITSLITRNSFLKDSEEE